MVAISSLILAVPLLVLFLLWKYSYWYRRGVPQGNPLKLLGDFNEITLTTAAHYKKYLHLARKFSGAPFYGVYSLGSPYLVVQDREMLKDITTRKFNSFGSNGFEIREDMDPIVSRDPFFQPNGERWKETRTSFSSLMTPGRLRTMTPDMAEAFKETIKYLKDQHHESGKGDGVNIKEVASKSMTNLLIRLTLSLDAGCFQPGKNPFLDAVQEIFDLWISGSKVMLALVLSPTIAQSLGFRFLPKTVVDFFKTVVRGQQEYRKENGITRNDILDTIMKKTYDVKTVGVGAKKTTVSSEELRELDVLSVIIMFVMEGFETTSTNITTAIVELARNPDIQETLRHQILTDCPLGTDINEEALNNIPLLQNCLLEALRLYPPAMVSQRIVTETVTLEARNGDKVTLGKGSTVLIPILTNHRDPEYFPEPEKFDPDRFGDENQRKSLIGFGDGPRQCPGQKLALLASKVLLVMILREFKIELSPKTQVPLEPVNNYFIFSLNEVLVRFVPA